MSKHSTSRLAGERARAAARPPTPPAGPESTVSAAWRGGLRGVDQPAGGLHDLRLGQPAPRARSREPRAGSRRAAARARRRARSWRCARTRGRCRRARARARRGRRAAARAMQLAEQPLVLGVRVGVQQRDRDRLGLGRARAARRARARARRSSARSGPSGVIRSGAPKRSSARHERRGRARAQPVEVRARLAAELDTSVKPSVAISAVRAVRPSSSAFVATVMPWAKRSTSAGSRAGRARARRAPPRARRATDRRAWSGTLAVCTAASVADEHGVGEGAADVDAEEHRRGAYVGPLYAAASSSSRSSVSARCWWDGQ